MKHYILSIDQGTTSSRAILFDYEGNPCYSANHEFKQIFPREGWVEHDPDDIFESVMKSINDVISINNIDFNQIKCIGITNQRETTILWDKKTGRPVHNAIVWQCRRTADRCDKLNKSMYRETIYNKTGLVIDPYFSATKIEFILQQNKELYTKAANGELAFGTVESFLIYKLSGGKYHVTDYSNASRTMLFNINTLQWDDELLQIFNIPRNILPEVVSNTPDNLYTSEELFGGNRIPITGVAGDQQAALFGQRCFDIGDSKNTYGTGCFLLMNIGEKILQSKNNLLTTIAWNINGKTTYAMEGAVFIGGAVVQWLRDGLKIINDSAETEKRARQSTNQSLYFVPSFSGLGTPYWDSGVRGAILGIARDTTQNDLIKASLEAIAFQSKDLLEAMKSDFGGHINKFQADGGASANRYLMQFQADIIRQDVNTAVMSETTALGAALLAGLKVGIFQSFNEIMNLKKDVITYKPQLSDSLSLKKYKRWKEAIKAVRDFRF